MADEGTCKYFKLNVILSLSFTVNLSLNDMTFNLLHIFCYELWDTSNGRCKGSHRMKKKKRNTLKLNHCPLDARIITKTYVNFRILCRCSVGKIWIVAKPVVAFNYSIFNLPPSSLAS